MKKNQTETHKIDTLINDYVKQIQHNYLVIKNDYGGFQILDLLCDPGFSKKFNRAKDLYADAMCSSDKFKKLKMAQMLLRAYEALSLQIQEQNIQKLDPWVKAFRVDDHIYYVFENQDYLAAVKKTFQSGSNISYISIEELLRCVPKGFRDIRESLNKFDATIEQIL